MIFYNFYTSRYRDPLSLVYRTEDGMSELQVNLKMFDSEESAKADFRSLLWDNEDFRQGEFFDTEKGKRKPQKEKSPQEKTYNTLPSDFSIELDKVYCLDCLLFMKQLPDNYLDYIFTSPPYNITKQIGGGDLYSEYSDDLTSEEYFNWISELIDLGMQKTKKHFFLNIQMLGRNKITLLGLLGKYKMLIKDIIIWNKKIAAPHIQPGVMNSKFEFILILSNDCPEKKVFYDASWSQGTFNNVLEGLNASRNQYADLNKATFPLYLPRTIMQKFGKKLDIWYDPFSGTGTTFHAAILEERHFLGTEIGKEQCEATNKRIWVEENALKIEFPDESIKISREDLAQSAMDEILNEPLPEPILDIQTKMDF